MQMPDKFLRLTSQIVYTDWCSFTHNNGQG